MRVPVYISQLIRVPVSILKCRQLGGGGEEDDDDMTEDDEEDMDGDVGFSDLFEALEEVGIFFRNVGFFNVL
jgi:hypothetical protein